MSQLQDIIKFTDLLSFVDITLLLGTISAILLIFSGILSIKPSAIKLRISKDKIKKASFFSTVAFTFTLIIILIDNFLY